MRHHLFQKFFGKMVKIKEMSFLSTRGIGLMFGNCINVFQNESNHFSLVTGFLRVFIIHVFGGTYFVPQNLKFSPGKIQKCPLMSKNFIHSSCKNICPYKLKTLKSELLKFLYAATIDPSRLCIVSISLTIMIFFYHFC